MTATRNSNTLGTINGKINNVGKTINGTKNERYIRPSITYNNCFSRSIYDTIINMDISY